MVFDAEAYRKEARAAGIPDHEIERDIAEETKGVNSTTGDANMANVKVDQSTFGIPDYTVPAAALGGTVAGGIAAPKVYKSIKDRFFAPAESTQKIQPLMDVNQRPTGPQEPKLVGDLFPADVSTKPVVSTPQTSTPTIKPVAPIPENPTVPLTTEVGKPPKEMPMIEKAAGNVERNAVAEGKKKVAIVPPPSQPSLMTGSGMPAYQGTGPKGTKLSTNIPSLALVPEDKVFVPGGQFMDIIRNATGQEAYTGNLKKYGYPETPQKGYETARSINESLGRATREEAKAAGAALGENTKAITQKVGGIKGVKVGGVVGALISLTDLAKADTLRQGLGNVAEGLMPIGISPSELASGKLTEKQLNAYKEAQKLGSPYRSVPPPR